MILLWSAIPLLSAYVLLILFYRYAFDRAPRFQADRKATPDTLVSVIVPARNEAGHISTCMDSLLSQSYPRALSEFIIVDDHSTDDTAALVAGYAEKGIRLIRLSNEPDNGNYSAGGKKAALHAGILAATGKLIVTTDADCICPDQWLQTLVQYYASNHPKIIAAPVMFHPEKTALDIFQTLDFLSLQGITAASVAVGFHGMSNGANLAYERDSFLSVEGFKGIDDIASGDDMLLMQKITQQFPGSAGYCFSKHAIVATAPAKTLQDFLQQRIRWASKARFYKEKRMFFVLLLVFLLNLCLAGLLLECVFFPELLSHCLLLIGIKTIAELVFLWPVARFFGKTHLLWFFPVAQPLHIFYTVLAGFLGQITTYHWKGRKVK